MKLSTKTRYTLRALIDLAINGKKGPVQIKEIASRQNLSIRYLENLFTVLRAQGLLNSSKGKGGGFILNRDPKDINLLEVIEIVEGKLSLVGCVESDSYCQLWDDCVTRLLWIKASKILSDFFKSYTLQDMVNEYNRIKNKNKNMYYI